MPEIENLDIQISAGASAASSNISNLTGKFKKLGDSVKGCSEFVREFAAGFKEGFAEGFGDKVTSATRDLDKFSKKVEQTTETVRQGSVFWTEFAKGFQEGFEEAMNRGEGALSRFFKQIKRVATYRLIRTALKMITEAVTQGMKNLYAYSALADGKFKASMDSLASSASYAGNSIAAMAGPLINALAPAIDFVVDKIVVLINWLNQLFSVLGGSRTYTAAKRTSETWKNAAKSAGGAAADIKKTILGFDEINKLQGQASGGGGGGGAASNFADMFEEKELSGFFKWLADLMDGWPEWLRWLFGGTALIGGFKLIKSFLPWLIGKLGELILLKLPSWLLKLFGVGGDDAGDLLPDGGSGLGNAVKGVGDLAKGLGELGSFSNLLNGLWQSLGGAGIAAAVAGLSGLLTIINSLIGVLGGLFSGGGNKDLTVKVKYEYPDKIDGPKEFVVPVKFSLPTDGIDVQVNLVKGDWKILNELMATKGVDCRINLHAVPSPAELYAKVREQWNAISENNPLEAVVDMVMPTAKKIFGQLRTVLTVRAEWVTTASDLWGRLRREWEAIRPTLPARADITTAATELWNKLLSEWNAIPPVFMTKAFLTTKATELWATIWNEWNRIETRLPIVAYIQTTAAQLWSMVWYAWSAQADLHVLPVYVGIVNQARLWWDSVQNWWYNTSGILYTTVQVRYEYSGPTVTGVSTGVSGSGGSGAGNGTSYFGGGREFGGGTSSGGGVGRKALGGILSGGRWHNIPAFAGGGIFGSMFLAGEAGPELVGHVGNRTEVLNKSQIASAMFAAVRSAMAPTEIGMREAMSGGSTSTTYGNRTQNDATLIDLLREQNALLQEIAGKEITTSGINYAQARSNRRAGVTVAPVAVQ